MVYREAPQLHPLVAVYDLEAYAFDRRTGAILWRYSAASTIARFALAHDRVYLLDEQCLLHCLDASAGTLVGVVEIDQPPMHGGGGGGALITDSDLLYVATERKVTAINAQGQVVWSAHPDRVLGSTKPGLGLPGNVMQKDFAARG